MVPSCPRGNNCRVKDRSFVPKIQIHLDTMCEASCAIENCNILQPLSSTFQVSDIQNLCSPVLDVVTTGYLSSQERVARQRGHTVKAKAIRPVCTTVIHRQHCHTPLIMRVPNYAPTSSRKLQHLNNNPREETNQRTSRKATKIATQKSHSSRHSQGTSQLKTWHCPVYCLP